MDASPEFPIHFLNIYILFLPACHTSRGRYGILGSCGPVPASCGYIPQGHPSTVTRAQRARREGSPSLLRSAPAAHGLRPTCPAAAIGGSSWWQPAMRKYGPAGSGLCGGPAGSSVPPGVLQESLAVVVGRPGGGATRRRTSVAIFVHEGPGFR